MFDAVLFDFDGTLADTAPDLGATLNLLRGEAGLEPLPLATLRPYASNGVRGLLKIGFGIAPEDETYGRLQQRFLDLYPSMLCVGTRLFPGIPELLAALESRAIPWGVVTNKAQRFTLPLLAQLGLEGRAACVVSGDSARRPKPAPDPLWLAASALGVAPGRCLYAGDDLRDIEAARAAGMRSVAAAYGYLGDGPPIAEWGADFRIQAPDELIGLLAG